MKAVQLDIFGNEVQPKVKKIYRLHLYHNGYAGYKDIEAYTGRQALYLFYHEKRENRTYAVTDCYEVK
jgi:hypothetical protein